MNNNIIVPNDFSPLAEKAIQQAVVIALKNKSSITLLHVIHDKSHTRPEAEALLRAQAESIAREKGLTCYFKLRVGNLFEEIHYVTCEKEYNLMVVGAHRMKGIKQMLFGANILKLVEKSSTKVLVLQEASPLLNSFKRIVLPVSSHESFQLVLEDVCDFASIFDSEVMLYSINKPGFEWPNQLLLNIELATKCFESEGIKMTRVKEDATVYAMGYAWQTMKYANSCGADAICMMSMPSSEYYYFAHADKEALLMNEYHIPILCLGGGVNVD